MEKVGVTHRFEAFSPANSPLSITIVSKDFAFVRTLVRFCPSHAPLLPIILWSARAPSAFRPCGGQGGSGAMGATLSPPRVAEASGQHPREN
jgi:hypothetical protein